MNQTLHTLKVLFLVVSFLAAQASISSATDGTGVVTVTANGNSCVGFTPAQGQGPDNWEVAQGGSYTMTITGVTECSGSTITVFVQSSSTGNFCFNATGSNGTYSGTFNIPNPACHTMPISYKCGADQPCSNANTLNADGPSGNGKVHLRSSKFDGNCSRTGSDEDCNGVTCTLSLSGTTADAHCNGESNGSIDVTVSGAAGDVTYLWNDGATTEDRTGLPAGTYTVTATDENDCSASISKIINEPSELSIGETHINVSLFGGNDGSINITVSGGTGAYTYLWSDGATDEDRTGLIAGLYSVTVTDEHGCTSAQQVTITEPPCDCQVVENITVDSVSAAEAQVCWEGNACDESYIIAWRTVPNTEWLYSYVDAPEHCLIFTNHYDDVYEIQIATICQNGDTTDYTQTFTFATYVSCLPPTNPFTSNIKSTQAKLNWTGTTDASKYVIAYRETGAPSWTKKNVDASKISYVLKNLIPSTSYDWKIASKCIGTSRTVTGSYSAVQHFTTLSQKEGEEMSMADEIAVNVYPNPVHDRFTIEMVTDENTVSISIQNVLGQIVYTSQSETTNGYLKKEISLNQPEGMYIIHMLAGDKEFTQQLILQ